MWSLFLTNQSWPSSSSCLGVQAPGMAKPGSSRPGLQNFEEGELVDLFDSKSQKNETITITISN